VNLLDTSIWIDHLRSVQPAVARLLEEGQVLGHPWVSGELALGSLSRRSEILSLMHNLPLATVASAVEVSAFIEDRRLYGRGIGYVDAQLLASTMITPDARLWTRDQRLAAAAAELGCAAHPVRN